MVSISKSMQSHLDLFSDQEFRDLMKAFKRRSYLKIFVEKCKIMFSVDAEGGKDKQDNAMVLQTRIPSETSAFSISDFE